MRETFIPNVLVSEVVKQQAEDNEHTHQGQNKARRERKKRETSKHEVNKTLEWEERNNQPLEDE